MNHEELVKALHCPFFKRDMCVRNLELDAVVAIEALQSESKRWNTRCADCKYGNFEWHVG